MNYLYRVGQRVRIVGNSTIPHYAPLGQVGKKMFEIANSGESCIFVFPDSDTARKYMDFVTLQRPILHYEHEVYRCGSTQICYKHGDCTGTSVYGYQNYQSPPKGNWYYYKNGAKVV